MERSGHELAQQNSSFLAFSGEDLGQSLYAQSCAQPSSVCIARNALLRLAVIEARSGVYYVL